MNRDLLRQLWVTVSAIVCVYGTLLGTGLIGTRVEESSGGSLAADATLLAPAVSAFTIWSVIYLGLGAYTVWQWLPANRTSERARATGWLAGFSMLLNAGWLLVTQVGWIWPSVAVMVALALVLGVIIRRLTALPAAGWGEKVIVDGTFGAYLGWVAVATAANIAAAGASSGWTAGAQADQVIGAVVLVVAAGLGALFAQQFFGRLTVAAAMAWGLSWIAVARLTDAPESTLVGVVAIVAAVAVVAAALVFRRAGPLSLA